MAITQRFSTNAAIQYGESLTDYKIDDGSTGKKFLTNAPINRIIRANELSALYFLIDDSTFAGATLLKFKDEDGNTIYEDTQTLSSTYNIHNGVVIGFEDVPYYVPENTKKICCVVTSNANVFNNPDFTLGSGNTFTSWTLTQPSRTNLLLYSNTFQNAAWTKVNCTATDNNATAPDGTTTAALVQLGAGTATKGIAQTVSVASNLNRVAHFSVKQGTHRYVQIQIDGAVIFCNFDLQTGTIGSATSCTGEIYPENNGFYRCVIKYTSTRITPVLWAVNSLASGISPTTSSTGTFYVTLAQSEVGTFATPAILTTNLSVTTSVGEFLQSATGGIDGSRAMQLWADQGGITFAYQTRLLATANYKFNAWAKIINTGVTDPKIGLVINGVDVGRSAELTTEYQYIEILFSATAGTQVEAIFYENAESYGFAIIDKVSIRKVTDTPVTEERCFTLDESCTTYESQIQWINKLGGVDTWTFTGNPIESKNTSKEGLIEYPMAENYTPPNEIYAYRKIKSFESITLFHRCKDEETAIWLRSELMDAVAVYLKVGEDFHPIIPTITNQDIRNYALRNPNVRLPFRFAYDINVQTR